MTTAVFEKRLRALEEEVKELKKAAKKQPFYRVAGDSKIQKVKKLPVGLRRALREVEQGKLSGPFSTVEELRAHLER